MSLPNFNLASAFGRTASTDASTVTVMPLAGIDYCLLQCTGKEAFYTLWPALTAGKLADVTGAPIATLGLNSRVYRLPTDATGYDSVHNGQNIEIRDTDHTTVIAVGTVINVTKYPTVNTNGPLAYHISLTPSTVPLYWISVVLSGAGTSLATGMEVWPMTPAAAQGTYLPITTASAIGQTIRVPGWAVGGGIAFIAATTGTSVLVANHLVESS